MHDGDTTFPIFPEEGLAPGEGADFDVEPHLESPGTRHFQFSLAGRAFAFPLENVVGASRPLAVTPLPFVPEWVLGIANLRGDVLSIVDLRAFLGLESPKLRQEDRIVIAKSLKEELEVGLVIDRIDGIRLLQEAPSPPEAPAQDGAGHFTLGICEHDGVVLSVLDIERLLLSPAMKQFDTARV